MRLKRIAGVVALLVVACCLATPGGAARWHSTGPHATGPIFSGNGGRNLPPFRVTAHSTLRWTNTGQIFQIFNANISGGGGINSTARIGATYLAPGRYRLQVNAIGGWTIRVTRGTESPRSIGGGLIGFRGNGARDLPPFTTRRGTNLVWTNTGQIFQIFPKNFSGGGDVNSQAHRGKSYMNAGRHVLSVNAIGNWTIGWRP